MLRSLLFLLLAAGTASAQLDALRAEIRAVYAAPGDYRGRGVPFFREVKNKPNLPDYIRALRAELDDRTTRAGIRADQTAALMFLSDTDETLVFAARTLARMSAREIGILSFYDLARPLANKGVDVSLAAFRLLEQPDVRMYWVSPFYFEQAELVASLLLLIDEKYWADGAIERLAAERDETAQKSLLKLLWYIQSDFADAELAKFADNPKKPAASRDLARELVSREPELSALDRAEALAESEEELRTRRRTRQRGLYFKNIMPFMERDTMKILFHRRLAREER